MTDLLDPALEVFSGCFYSFDGFWFLHASANAKMVNLATNFVWYVFFVLKGKIIWQSHFCLWLLMHWGDG
jgi:hypothetical protein